MQWTQKKKYLAVAVGAFVLGGLVYGGKQYLAARELAAINNARIDGGWYAEPLAYQGDWYLVPPNEVYSSGIEEGNIPALTNPNTMTIAEADDVIADNLGGISVEIEGEVRFYPVQIMNWHEVVHDTLGGKSLLVYYGPLTGAAAVYELPEGKKFTVSGQEYNNDVLLREEGTETLWSGIRGTPVVAANQEALNESFVRVASTFMTWGEWKKAHSTGTVLSTNTGFDRDYTRHPYGNYESSPGVYFPVNHSAIPVRAKEPAYAVTFAQGTVLLLNTVSLLDQTPSVQVGEDCVVGFHDTLATYTNMFLCKAEDQTFTFSRAGTDTFVDEETGSTWNAGGLAIAGSLKGTQLKTAQAVRLYTFAADAFFPTASLIGSEFIFTEETPETSSVDPSTGAAIEGENVDGATIEIVPSE